MYHRVIPRKEAQPGLQAGMYVEPDTFEMQIQYLKNSFKIIPFSQIYAKLNNKEAMNSNLPICIITFDDGWLDFFKYAYPVLLKHEIPATLFLPTEFIGSENMFWTDEVAYIVSMKNSVSERFPEANRLKNFKLNNLVNLKGTPDSQIEEMISTLKGYGHEDILKIIKELKEYWGINSYSKERSFLNWDEIRLMANSGLVTFGSHTANHRILVHISEKEIVDELNESKNRLLSEGVVKNSFIPFCYPNGDYDERVVQIVRKSGYHVAVTTEDGWNRVDTPKFILNRVAIHQDMSSNKELFKCRIAGIF